MGKERPQKALLHPGSPCPVALLRSIMKSLRLRQCNIKGIDIWKQLDVDSSFYLYADV